MYAEWDTQETIDAVADALAERHSVTLIEADEQAFERLKVQKPDIVFNIAEGLHSVSRESQIPAMLDMLRIPYTGSDPLTLGICLDKSRAKEILTYNGIPTPKFFTATSSDELSKHSLHYPLFVKPLHEGSSKGIYNNSVVRTEQEARNRIDALAQKYHQPILVEEYLEGREFTVALLGNGDGTRVLPIVEIRFDSLPDGVNKIYSYEAKWIWDRPDNPIEVFQCPAKIDELLRSSIEHICKSAYTVLRCKDWTRIDVRLDSHGNPFILEVNPLPGILPNPEEHSCFPMAARSAGYSYNDMINAVLDAATARYGIR